MSDRNHPMVDIHHILLKVDMLVADDYHRREHHRVGILTFRSDYHRRMADLKDRQAVGILHLLASSIKKIIINVVNCVKLFVS